MKEKLLTTICGLIMAFAMTSVQAVIVLTPGDAAHEGSVPNNPDADDVETIVGSSADLFSLYKADVDSPVIESGSFAGNYTTTYSNSATDPSDASITWDGGDYISCPECWLVVKDGNQDPIWYIFDLNEPAWDGMEEIQLTGFWPDQGAISHIDIVGVPVPAAVWLFGSGLLGLVGVARRRKNV